MSQTHKTPENELEALRRLLTGPDQARLEKLEKSQISAEGFSDKVTEVLPQAFKQSSENNNQLSEAMVPTVENIIRISINRDINRFAEALFPVIGPSIRKAIAESIRQMLQSMNQMLDSSLSWQGLKWRLESMRTGVSFAEVVMLHSLVYRVEEVFLIHRETGLLLNHATYAGHEGQDADLVSSMLTAIGDFVGDSFDVDAQEGLDTVQFGELTLWLQHGPKALIAVAIRGDAPERLRLLLQEELEAIELEFAQAIEQFEGDISALEPSRPHLENCLQFQVQRPQKKLSWMTRLVWLLLSLLILYGLGAQGWQNHQEQQYLAQLQQQPGYVITETRHSDGRLQIYGLRDPLAPTTEALLALSGLQTDEVTHHWRPYQSLEQTFVRQRLEHLLELPANVTLVSDENQLVLSGYAEKSWITQLQQQANWLGGATQLDVSAVQHTVDLTPLALPEGVQYQLDLNRGLLRLHGEAQESWWNTLAERVQQIPAIQTLEQQALRVFPDFKEWGLPDTVNIERQGSHLIVTGEADTQTITALQQRLQQYDTIQTVDLRGLQNLEAQGLEQAMRELRQQIILFGEAEALQTGSGQALQQAATLAASVWKNARILGASAQFQVSGFSDSLGSFQDNVILSQARARFVADYLIQQGIPAENITLHGITQPVAREATPAERRYNRRVTLDVLLSPANLP